MPSEVSSELWFGSARARRRNVEYLACHARPSRGTASPCKAIALAGEGKLLPREGMR
jgi:hypothetical protein